MRHLRWIAPLCALLALSTLTASPAQAQGKIKQAGNFGLGLGIGTLASGLSGKYFLESNLSIQGNVGLHYYGPYGRCYRRGPRRYCDRWGDALGLSADLLSERGPLAGNDQVSLDWQIGGGLGLGIWERAPVLDVAAAFVLGLQVNVHALPIDVVLEYRPKLIILSDVDLDLIDFTAQIRYYFGG